MTDTEQLSREERILRVMKQVLTRVVRETATAPGMKHPLSEQTIDDIRHCLYLMSERERELVEARGSTMDMRPRVPGQHQEPQGDVVVSLDAIRRQKPQE